MLRIVDFCMMVSSFGIASSLSEPLSCNRSPNAAKVANMISGLTLVYPLPMGGGVSIVRLRYLSSSVRAEGNIRSISTIFALPSRWCQCVFSYTCREPVPLLSLEVVTEGFRCPHGWTEMHRHREGSGEERQLRVWEVALGINTTWLGHSVFLELVVRRGGGGRFIHLLVMYLWWE